MRKAGGNREVFPFHFYDTEQQENLYENPLSTAIEQPERGSYLTNSGITKRR